MPHDLIPVPERRSLAFIAILAVGVVAYYLKSDDYTFQAVLMSVATLAAPAAIAIGIRCYRPAASLPWWTLAIGVGVMALGTSIDWLLPVFGVEVGTPSIADVFYVPGYLLMLIALWLLVRGRASDAGARLLSLDAGILAMPIGILVWAFVVGPVVDTSAMSVDGLLVTIAYPLIDVLMLGIVIDLLLPGHRTRATQYLAAAIAAGFLSDIAWTYLAATGTYQSSTIVDLGWLLLPMFLGAAALHPSMASLGVARVDEDIRASHWRLVSLGAASIVAPAVILLQGTFGYTVDNAEIATGAILLSLLVVARLSLTLRELGASLDRRSLLQGQLSHQARHDPLTGLANRMEFSERLQACLQGTHQRPAVLLLDLDDFKAVNDSQGHQIGDGLLIAVASRLRGSLRGNDLACRLGGDEFAILIDDCAQAETAMEVANRLLRALEAPFEVGGHMVFAHASIGVALGASSTAYAADLLRDADIAMYLAKGQGKRRAELYQPSMHSGILERIALRADLEEAIERRQFVLEYQPIYAIDDGRLHGVEALVRWLHPSRGQLPPSDFIDLAEDTGLIVPLGAWILNEACRQMAAWRAGLVGARNLDVAVNVSAIQIRHPGFLDQLRAALRESGLPPSSLVLELTESVLSDSDASLRVLEDLKRIGVRLAIDDFGTGYSSLSYVGRFPVDILKIDQAFTAALGTASKEAALTATIIELAGNLHLKTIAEGIEEESQLATLRALGCEMGQGFHLARPLSPERVTALISELAPGRSLPNAPRPGVSLPGSRTAVRSGPA